MSLYLEHSLFTSDMAGWKMAGAGGFRVVADDTIESYGGSGLLWYAEQVYENLVLNVDWRIAHRNDNSGVFIRIPALGDDLQPAIERGYEVQIDERAYDPARKVEGSALHATGAIYKLAPASTSCSKPVGEWNHFEIYVRGGLIQVKLNGVEISHLTDASREPRGHIALQAHHEGSRVQFRDLRVRRLEE